MIIFTGMNCTPYAHEIPYAYSIIYLEVVLASNASTTKVILSLFKSLLFFTPIPKKSNTSARNTEIFSVMEKRHSRAKTKNICFRSQLSIPSVMYLIMLHGELKALQVSHSEGEALDNRVVRRWSDQVVKERGSDEVDS